LQYEYVVCNESSSGTGAAVDLFAVLDLGDAQPKKQKDFAFARVNATRHSVAAGLAQLRRNAREKLKSHFRDSKSGLEFR
jgi:hypothetical protein